VGRRREGVPRVLRTEAPGQSTGAGKRGTRLGLGAGQSGAQGNGGLAWKEERREGRGRRGRHPIH
jgi:hypothetical protein